ncbi:MAG: deoxynucleoside kinase [Ignavibacteria bacterium]|nr:deoxynucleoside kinase [Ignavibacteria bacterium]
MQGNSIKYIAIEGVIGAGKTSLAKKIAEKLNAKLILENFEDNPFLEKFYKSPSRYAFHTQMYFLLSRYKQLLELRQADLFHNYIISDYIFEKDKIFAYLNLADDELELYEKMVSFIERNIPTPDLVIYLQSTVERLMANINKRGRPAEKGMSENYIRDLNEGYNYFFFRYKASRIMIVNAANIDFVNDKNDFDNLIAEILKSEHGNIEYFDPASKKTSGL